MSLDDDNCVFVCVTTTKEKPSSSFAKKTPVSLFDHESNDLTHSFCVTFEILISTFIEIHKILYCKDFFEIENNTDSGIWYFTMYSNVRRTSLN